MDDIADHLEIFNALVVMFEKNHGIMDVIRWIESHQFQLENFDIISFMIGRADVKHSRQWFTACVDELLLVCNRMNHLALVLLGAAIPLLHDTKFMIKRVLGS